MAHIDEELEMNVSYNVSFYPANHSTASGSINGHMSYAITVPFSRLGEYIAELNSIVQELNVRYNISKD